MQSKPNGPSVAIIDIGSNSIKVLVARRSPSGLVEARATRTIDARISAGISREEPRLTEEGMARGVAAVQILLQEARAFEPEKIVAVATSAVRDARNGRDFQTRVRAATGQEIRILSGEEEADLIGRGLTCDPTLHALRNFYVFDLGGGSLECLAFRDRKIEQAISLPLGCVRLTERFIADSAGPIVPDAQDAIAAHTRDALVRSGFRFSLPPDASAVATGGTATTVRAIRGARTGITFEQSLPVVRVSEVRDLLKTLGAMALIERRQVAGLPPARADVFPAALATLLSIAELGSFAAFQNSVYNLRYGLADATLPP